MADTIKTESTTRTLSDLIPKDTLLQLPVFYQLLQEDGKKILPEMVKSSFHQEDQYLCYPFYKPISRMWTFQKKNETND
ncbi:MAG: hypothetical protein R3E32_19735 [Chitinophagales bacterium]